MKISDIIFIVIVIVTIAITVLNFLASHRSSVALGAQISPSLQPGQARK